MGPALVLRSSQLASPHRTYASQAGKAQVDEIHKKEGVCPVEPGFVCPYASAAAAKATQAAGSCPAHAKGATNPRTPKAHHEHTATSLDYWVFFVGGQRRNTRTSPSATSRNNIDRLAAKFPVAHTGSQSDEVSV